MKFKRLAAALLSAAMVVSLAACSNNKESAESGSGTTGTEAVHVNLAESWGFEYFYTIITPEVSSSQYDITYYLTSFYDTLVTYNENNELVGSLAEDWSMSDDGLVYTFQIREGVKFSDGSDLTAEDVAKSLMAVPVNLGQYNGGYGRLSTIIESAEATGDYTVELRLTQPYYNTLRELCLANPFGIVSSEQLNDDLTALDTSAADYWSLYVSPVTVTDIKSMDVTYNGQTNTIVRNTEETTDEDGDTTQTITYTWNGEEVDKTEASTLYSSAVTMTAQSKDFAYEKTGEDELVLVMHTDDGDYTVSFSPYDSSFYYVVDLEGVPSLVNKNNVNSLIDAYLTVIGEK